MTGKNVIVVEDEPKIARLLADYLVRDGFVVTILAEGSAAVEAIRGVEIRSMAGSLARLMKRTARSMAPVLRKSLMK